MRVPGSRWGRAMRAVVTAGVLAATMGVGLVASAQSTTTVSCTVGASPECQGLAIGGANQAGSDSIFTTATVGGKQADVFSKNTVSPTNPFTYIYVQVPTGSSFLSGNPTTMYLTIEYYDQGQGITCTTAAPCQLAYNYETTGTGIPAYYAGPAAMNLGGTAAWKTVTYKLTATAFQGNENFQADFRISGTQGVAVHKWTLSLQAPASASSSTSSATASSSTSSQTASSTATATSSSSSATSVPKTGGSPFVPLAGGLVLMAGAALILARFRDSRA